jgi:hypothetical protein
MSGRRKRGKGGREGERKWKKEVEEKRRLWGEWEAEEREKGVEMGRRKWKKEVEGGVDRGGAERRGERGKAEVRKRRDENGIGRYG